jgi:hypothetical protein
VNNYAAPQNAGAEFEAEWQALCASLIRRGGLEAALERVTDSAESRELKRREQRSIDMIVASLHRPG